MLNKNCYFDIVKQWQLDIITNLDKDDCL